MTKNILYELQDTHLIFETISDNKNEEVYYLPGIDINKLTVGMLLEKLDTVGSESFNLDHNLYSSAWDTLINIRKTYIYRNNQILLKDL